MVPELTLVDKTEIIDPSPIPPLKAWIAHTPSKKRKNFHLLVSHTLGVTEKAVSYASVLHPNASQIAQFIGVLHDLGKFTQAFQLYLWNCYLADQSEGARPQRGSAPHKQMGALAAELLDANYGYVWKQVIYGHHSAMKSLNETDNGIQGTFSSCTKSGVRTSMPVSEPFSDVDVRRLLLVSGAVDSRLVPVVPDIEILTKDTLWRNKEDREMFIRLIYSCLVDADGLDTEDHKNPDAKSSRNLAAIISLSDLLNQLRGAQEEDFEGALGTVNDVRREVYAACLAVSEAESGFFELTVPTGGGKTRSSLAFALAHAVKREKRRVIYAIPYTSIVDQTVGVFHKLFGSDPGTVLEHHSAVEPRSMPKEREEEDRTADTEQWRLLAAENWDAPLIVTTTVQLFESLFANRPGACRKLHRIAHSVIVLDEVQCLPPHLLGPIRSALRCLVQHFGVTVVFCTATQPAHELASPYLEGVETTPIVKDPKPHFDALKRVDWHVEREPWDWDTVAAKMYEQSACLCIVNTRKQALALMAALGDDDSVLHLSTLLCGRHRKDVLKEVKRRLDNKEPVRLVSTQVVEAGVDISFPCVLRAIGPLERIIQAAGRCNRENELFPLRGQVTIFTPVDDSAPRGFYAMGKNRTENLLDRGKVDFDDPEFVTAYFRGLYGDLLREADSKNIRDDREHRRYETVAEKFKMIDEDTVSVFVTTYAQEEANAILNAARAIGAMTRDLWRRAQPFCVSVPYRDVQSGTLSVMETVPGLQLWMGTYDRKTGIPLDRGMADLTTDFLIMDNAK